jgi:hypothetical protein
VLSDIYHGETIFKPSVCLSQPIKGRTPDAKYMKAQDLMYNEPTLYFEPIAFAIEIPSIWDEVSGNKLSLTVGVPKPTTWITITKRKAQQSFVYQILQPFYRNNEPFVIFSHMVTSFDR